jgi:hypothetical protein
MITRAAHTRPGQARSDRGYPAASTGWDFRQVPSTGC